MFNLSGSEIVVILLLALVVLGPEKLPDAIRRAGRTYSELKKMGNSFQAEMKSVLDEPMKEMRDTADLLKKSMDFTDGELTGQADDAAADHATAAKAFGSRRRRRADDRRRGARRRRDRRRRVRDRSRRSFPTPSTRRRPHRAPEPDAQPSPEDELINRTLSGEA